MRRWVALLIIGLTALALIACSQNNNAARSIAAPQSAAASNTAAGVPGGNASGNVQAPASTGSVPQIVEAVRPSVVLVWATGRAQRGLFGQSGPAPQGTGTGILLDDQGHILTNNHVVTLESAAAAQTLKVNLRALSLRTHRA